jgi:hypothetical protein
MTGGVAGFPGSVFASSRMTTNANNPPARIEKVTPFQAKTGKTIRDRINKICVTIPFSKLSQSCFFDISCR